MKKRHIDKLLNNPSAKSQATIRKLLASGQHSVYLRSEENALFELSGNTEEALNNYASHLKTRCGVLAAEEKPNCRWPLTNFYNEMCKRSSLETDRQNPKPHWHDSRIFLNLCAGNTLNTNSTDCIQLSMDSDCDVSRPRPWETKDTLGLSLGLGIPAFLALVAFMIYMLKDRCKKPAATDYQSMPKEADVSPPAYRV